MKIYAIIDANNTACRPIGYLMYHTSDNSFNIELSKSLTEQAAPILFASFISKGKYSIDKHWSKEWVRQRIVPTDRQNLGLVLKENGLKTYDEHKLLMLANGRCAQDECYLSPISDDAIPGELQEYLNGTIRDVFILSDYRVLIALAAGEIRVLDVAHCASDNTSRVMTYYADRFSDYSISSGGHAIVWGSEASISCSELPSISMPTGLTLNDIASMIKSRIVDTGEACRLLNCTRQNLNYLVKRGKLSPIVTSSGTRLFLRGELESYSR